MGQVVEPWFRCALARPCIAVRSRARAVARTLPGARTLIRSPPLMILIRSSS